MNAKEIADEHQRLGALCQAISEQLAKATEQLSLRIESNELDRILTSDDEDEDDVEENLNDSSHQSELSSFTMSVGSPAILDAAALKIDRF